ncbi:MAG: hypothetical protein HF962_01465 [Sulfurovum sp.]|nr:hypothetical protein [Sulfurovum sp.]
MNIENARPLTVDNATVEFIEGTVDGVTTYKFDTTKEGHPMVNAMAGLAILGDDEQLLMVNHCAPMGLYPKIENEFNHSHQEMPDGTTHILFTKKEGTQSTTDFSATSCGGGC